MPLKTQLINTLSYDLNLNLIKKGLAVKNCDEASKIALRDRITDWLNDGMMYEAIQQFYNQFLQLDELTPVQAAHYFCNIRNLIKKEHQSECKFLIDTDDLIWSMSLKIKDDVLYQTPDQMNNSEFFQICALQKVMQAIDDVHKASAILSLENYIIAKIECMSDEKTIQQALYQALDDLNYSAENYRSCRTYHQQYQKYEDAPQFLAKFKNGEWLLSDRPSTCGEFRGQLLKDELSSGNYINFRDLLSRGHMGSEDLLLKYTVSAAKNELVALIEALGKADQEVAKILYQKKVGNTSLGALFNWPKPLAGNNEESCI